MQLSREEAAELAAALGVTDEARRHVLSAATLAEAQARLDELKARVRKALRLLARELHPDVTGGDPEKTERLTRLNVVASAIERAKITPAPPAPPVVWVHVQPGWVTGTASTTSATYTRTW